MTPDVAFEFHFVCELFVANLALLLEKLLIKIKKIRFCCWLKLLKLVVRFTLVAEKFEENFNLIA